MKCQMHLNGIVYLKFEYKGILKIKKKEKKHFNQTQEKIMFTARIFTYIVERRNTFCMYSIARSKTSQYFRRNISRLFFE